MISYKVKGIILAVILSLASIMMPFSVYADTITTNNIKGINTILLSKTQDSVITNSYWYVYEHTITLDANYVGTINLNINLTYYNPSGSSQTYGVSSLNNKNYYVNGNTIKINQIVTSDNYGNQGPFVSSSYLLNSSNVIKYDDIDSLQQIIDLLSDIYQNSEDIEGLSTNQLAELEDIVANTSLANQYLETISELRQYNFTYESFSAVYAMMKNHSEKIVDIFNYSYWQYPVFSLVANDLLFSPIVESKKSYIVIFYTEANINENNYSNYISFNSNFDMTYELVNRFYINGNRRVIKLTFYNRSSSSRYLDLYTISSNVIIPFYTGYEENKNVSTEFALQFNLTNSLLDNIQIIANGTSQSNSAASDLESEASEYSEISDDVIGVEEGLTSNFETEVNKIDLDTGLNVFGGNFMTSATWVRTQFDRLTENNPYGSLVVYGLTLGFALLMLGKVFL